MFSPFKTIYKGIQCRLSLKTLHYLPRGSSAPCYLCPLSTGMLCFTHTAAFTVLSRNAYAPVPVLTLLSPSVLPTLHQVEILLRCLPVFIQCTCFSPLMRLYHTLLNTFLLWQIFIECTIHGSIFD